MGSPRLNGTIAYVVVSVVIAIIAIVVTWKLLRLLWRIIDQTILAGVSAKVRWISLGVTALFSGSLVVASASALRSWVIMLGSTIPSVLYQGWLNAMEACAGTNPIERCLGELAFAELNGWSKPAERYLNANSAFPIVGLLIFFAAWCALANLFSIRAKAGEDETIWVARMYAGTSHTVRLNTILFVVIAVAVYLSMAAVAAIPQLQEKTELGTEASAERLRQQLEASAIVSPDLKSLQDNPFEAVERALNAAPANVAATANTTPASAQPPEPAQPQSTPSQAPAPSGDQNQWLRTELNTVTNRGKWWRQATFSDLLNLIQSARKDAKAGLDRAVATYGIAEKTRKGSRQQADHFVAIMAWYDRNTSNLERNIHTCESTITSADRGARLWSERAAQTIANKEQILPQNEERDMYNSYSNAVEVCRPLTLFDALPERPALGSNLGPFRYLASWLLDTESLALVLIVGMFGFGLLGSACSTFVREKGTKDEAAPLVKDLGGVVIRGLSAAIVVFLAVEGGLAIFGATGGEPNPYVLLLTCLVGAVFSESIWEWAQRRLLSGIESADEPESEEDKPKETPTPATT